MELEQYIPLVQNSNNQEGSRQQPKHEYGDKDEDNVQMKI